MTSVNLRLEAHFIGALKPELNTPWASGLLANSGARVACKTLQKAFKLLLFLA